MDYEKKYRNALSWMRAVYPTLNGMAKEDAEHFFPELTESDDKRIWEAIVREFERASDSYLIETYGLSKDKFLAYLEKQKEQKPAEDWREERKKECPFRVKLDNNLYGCKRYADVVCACAGNCSWVVDYPKLKEIQDRKEQKPVERHLDLTELLVPQRNIEQKPNSEFDPNSVKNKSYSIQIDQWSEDDEHKRRDAIYFLESARGHYADTSEIDKTINFLKALRPQPKQEWSEEDEKKLEDLTSLLAILEGCSTVNVGTAAKYNGWLKSFRSRPKSSDNWKPSGKQINALQDSIDLDKTVLRRGILIGLLVDLKRLM